MTLADYIELLTELEEQGHGEEEVYLQDDETCTQNKDISLGLTWIGIEIKGE